MWGEGRIHGLVHLGCERMETGATHLAPSDDKYDCMNDDVGNVGIPTFEISSVVPSLQDVVANGTLRGRTDVEGEVPGDGDTSHLETRSDIPQAPIMGTLQADLAVKVYYQMLPTARTNVLVYQGTYTAVPEILAGSSPDNSRCHGENGDDIDHRDCHSQRV